eukprot:TRINITY_DN549_c0_g1_i1.p1 TRINITY_DN549_c0_g1~~TRINITY_DN549_c0_g1_i1.p1  ORF type:complete len:291 (-),score=120.65 TRINITY_DN549_c0_g1_i1:6-815(-)
MATEINNRTGFKRLEEQQDENEVEITQTQIQTQTEQKDNITPCLVVQVPNGNLAIAYTEEFLNALETAESHQEFQRELLPGSPVSDVTILELGLLRETAIFRKRRKLLYLIATFDILYSSALIVFSFISEQNISNNRTELILVCYLIGSIISDVVGCLAAFAEILFLLSAFVLFEGVSLAFSLFTSFSPFIVFHVAVLLVSLQARVSLAKKKAIFREYCRLQESIDPTELQSAAESRSLYEQDVGTSDDDDNNNTQFIEINELTSPSEW